MKLKVHFVDDRYKDGVFDELKINLLLNNAKHTTSDAERKALCESIFDFKAFDKVDEAISYYNDNGKDFYPDLIVIDIDFSTLSGQGYDAKLLLTWGITMGEYIKKKIPECALIFLTGQASNTDVTDALKEKGINISKLDLIFPDEKSAIYIGRLEEKLKEIAKKKVSDLSEGTRRKLEKLEDYDVLPDEIDLGLQVINSRSLLWGYCDIKQKTKSETKQIFMDLLQGTGHICNFSGDWKDVDGCLRKALNNYQQKEDYNELKLNIDKKALNFFLELLRVKEKFEKTDAKASILMQKNHLNNITTTCQDNNSVFKERMIARRIALGYNHLFGNTTTPLTLETLCQLLHNKTTGYQEEIDKSTTSKKDNKKKKVFIWEYVKQTPASQPKPIFNKLGISYSTTTIGSSLDKAGNVKNYKTIKLNTNIEDRNSMLLEEREWILNFIDNTILLRLFLDEFTIDINDENNDIIKIIGHNDLKKDYIDLDDFEAIVDKLRVYPLIFARFIQILNDFFNNSDEYATVKPFLAKMLNIPQLNLNNSK